MALQKGGNGDEAFSRAAYDEQRDSEVQYGVKWALCVGTTVQKGVWSFRTTVFDVVERRGARPVVSLEESWPNARSGSFAAFLYQHNHKVARMVESWSLDAAKRDASRSNAR